MQVADAFGTLFASDTRGIASRTDHGIRDVETDCYKQAGGYGSCSARSVATQPLGVHLDVTLAALFVPCGILAHEVAHLFAGHLLSLPDLRLHFASFTHGQVQWLSPANRVQIAWAGPFTTMLFAIGGLYFWKIYRLRVLLAISVAAAARIAIVLPHAVAAFLLRVVGERLPPTGLDEDLGAEAVGLPGDLFLMAAAGFYLVVLIIVARTTPVWSAAGSIVGAAIGLSAWLYIVGPLVLS